MDRNKRLVMSREWYGELDKATKEYGLEKIHGEPCIYMPTDNRELSVAAYVDDIHILLLELKK